MAPASLVGWQRRTVPCPSSYAIMQDGGHAEPVITARAQWRVAGHAFARPVGLTHPADCELICFARKLNLDAQLRQINTTGKSVKTCRALRAKIFRLTRRANQLHNSARLTQLRGARDRHERAVRCDGRERRETYAPEAYGEVVWS